MSELHLTTLVDIARVAIAMHCHDSYQSALYYYLKNRMILRLHPSREPLLPIARR